MRLRPKTLAGAGALAAAVALAAGCSSAGSSSAGSGSASAAAADSGAPIKVGVIATLSAVLPGAFVQPWSVDGVQAAADMINAQGGINGRKIQVEVCDNGGDPNRDTQCARKAVTGGWVADVGGFDPYDPNLVLPILQAASIPYLGLFESAPVEYEASNTFPIEIGSVGSYVGTAAQMVSHGCKRPAFINITSQSYSSIAQDVKAVFDKAGVTYGGAIPYQTGTINFTPVVASALAQKPDCIMFVGQSSDGVKAFTGIRQAGSTAALFTPPGVLVPQVITALGKTADGIEGATGAPLPDNPSPAITQMIKNLGTYSKLSYTNEYATDGYAAVLLLQQALAGMKDITPANLLAKLNTMTNAQVLNFPPINYEKARASKVYPRMFNTYVWYGVVKNGEWTGLTASQPPVNIAQYLP